jgi:hypothetical protein
LVARAAHYLAGESMRTSVPAPMCLPERGAEIERGLRGLRGFER